MPESIFSLLGMLAIVVLILILAYWATKMIGSYGARSVTPTSAGRFRAGRAERFRTLGQISVGRNERLLLVQLQEKCYLLGVTAGAITLLKELDADEAREWLADEDARSAAPSFLDVLKENLRKRK